MELCNNKSRFQRNDSLQRESGSPYSDANWGTSILYTPDMPRSHTGVSVLAWNESQISPSAWWAAPLWNFLVAWQQLQLRRALSLGAKEGITLQLVSFKEPEGERGDPHSALRGSCFSLLSLGRGGRFKKDAVDGIHILFWRGIYCQVTNNNIQKCIWNMTHI